ncbi:nuclear transport factor 2 family protein [Henriciella sp. AS95]|uniref:nuclear transport factor 2 family protein n=1 Tax=Henriciella sp. AS95 TaxID=3135782 RepID=UPI003174A807
MDEAAFADWLAQVKATLDSMDGAAFAELFTKDAVFFEAPFNAPRKGRAAIHSAIDEMAGVREDSTFSAHVIGIEPNVGWAMWENTFTRAGTDDPVRLEGILKASFDSNGLCCEFQQWWHKLEPGQDDLMRDFDA